MLSKDIEFAKRIGPSQEGWRILDDGHRFLGNFRCPFCGDSKRSKRKKRAFFFEEGNEIIFKCHNCGTTMNIGSFLKEKDSLLYKEYRLGEFRNPLKDFITFDDLRREEPPANTSHLLDGLPRIDMLSAGNEGYDYIVGRKIPERFFSSIFFAKNYLEWANTHTTKFKNVSSKYEHSRVIFPWYSADGIVVGYSARSILFNDRKYINIFLDKEKKTAYGVERVNPLKKVHIIEGPIDSLFVDNCIAVANAALASFQCDYKERVYIPDRDVRTIEVMRFVEKMIDSGHGVCLLPDNLPDKDINGCIIKGYTEEQMNRIIEESTYHGIMAKLKFSKWRKI